MQLFHNYNNQYTNFCLHLRKDSGCSFWFFCFFIFSIFTIGSYSCIVIFPKLFFILSKNWISFFKFSCIFFPNLVLEFFSSSGAPHCGFSKIRLCFGFRIGMSLRFFHDFHLFLGNYKPQ